MTKHFADRWIEKSKEANNPCCVGLDPRPELFPESVLGEFRTVDDPIERNCLAIERFDGILLDVLQGLIPAVKPQVAFYECYGPRGMEAYRKTVCRARKLGFIVICDVKRGDIGSTVEAYARGFLGGKEEGEAPVPADAITINAYLGSDGIRPFTARAERTGCGLFALVKTSNPSSSEFQDLQTKDGKPIYEVMAGLVSKWGADYIGKSGYSFLGAVVGATHPDLLRSLRQIMPNTLFLLPGYGAQGASGKDVVGAFRSDGSGGIVVAARHIIYAFKREPYKSMDVGFREAVRNAAEEMVRDVQDNVKRS